MNAKLAEIYGTAEVADDTLEKQAAAELAEKLAASDEEDVNVEEMSDEDVEALAASVLESGDESESEESAESADESTDDESVQKVAEADYLGRVMAHSMVQEIREINAESEKTAGKITDAMKAFGGKAKAFGGTAKAKAMELGGKAKAHAKAGADKAKEHVKKHPKKYMAAGAAGAAGAGFAAGRKSKQSSATPALDQLALARAQELIDANELQKVSAAGDQYEVLAQAVDAKALEILESQGFDISSLVRE